jgi:hypothetical protein
MAGSNKWLTLAFIGNTPTSDLDTVPCASDYAVEVSVENQRIGVETRRTRGAEKFMAPLGGKVKEDFKNNVPNVYHIFMTDGGCKRLVEFPGEGGGTRFSTRCVVDVDQGALGKTCGTRVLGPVMKTLRDARAVNGTFKLYAFMKLPDAFGTQDSFFQMWGDFSVTHWWRPPMASMDCNVDVGELQYSHE